MIVWRGICNQGARRPPALRRARAATQDLRGDICAALNKIIKSQKEATGKAAVSAQATLECDDADADTGQAWRADGLTSAEPLLESRC